MLSSSRHLSVKRSQSDDHPDRQRLNVIRTNQQTVRTYERYPFTRDICTVDMRRTESESYGNDMDITKVKIFSSMVAVRKPRKSLLILFHSSQKSLFMEDHGGDRKAPPSTKRCRGWSLRTAPVYPATNRQKYPILALRKLKATTVLSSSFDRLARRFKKHNSDQIFAATRNGFEKALLLG